MKTWIMIISMLFAVHAKASETFFTAEKGGMYFEGGLNYFISNSETEAFSLESEFQDIKFSAQIEYGLFDFMSVYGNIGAGYGEIKDKTSGEVDQRFKALDNLNIGVKSGLKLGPGTFVGSSNFGIGLFENNGKNRTYGNYSWDVKLGYEMNASDKLLIGALVHQGVFSTEARFPGVVEVDLKGGTIMSFYGEFGLNEKSKILADFRYGINTAGLGLYNSVGSMGVFTIDTGFDDGDTSAFGLKASYVRNMDADGNMKLIASLSYDQSETTYIDPNDDSEENIVTGNLTLRLKL